MKNNYKKQFFTASKIIFLAFLFLSAKTSFGLTTIINPATGGGFESGGTFPANGWTVVNDTKDQWFVGAIGANSGSNGAYISKNATGTNNLAGSAGGYYNVSFFYQDVTIPAGETTITLSFNWRGQGDAYDCLQVFMVPTSTTITADNALYSGQIGTNYYAASATNWHTVTITLPCSYAGTTQRLVFSWVNDYTTQITAASVDNISLTSLNPGSPPSCASLLGGGVTNVASLPYSSGAGTTCGSTCNLAQNNAIICDDADYYTGLANVWIFTPTTSGLTTINLTSSGSYTGLMLYAGCPMGCSSTPGTCVGDAQDYYGNKSLTVCLTAGVTYYLVLDSYATPTCNPYSNLTISAPSGGGSPANDLPCGATSITLGSSVTDNNACATGTGEPAYPSCWTNGSINTLWYSFVAPASGKVNVTTTAGSLIDIQIVVYSGTCSSLTQVGSSCSYDNQTGCSGSDYYTSANLTGLTPGATYYVELDGYESETGSYTISAYDGSVAPPAVQAQDCALPNPVCSNQTTVGNPGYSGSGNYCDISSSYCLAEGDKNVVWYSIPITTSGNLVFAIVPNDYGNPNPYTGQSNPGYTAPNTTDYDFGLWKVAGSGTLATCATIASGAAPITSCNYSYIGVTGCYGTSNGTAPSNFTGGYGGGFNKQVAVTAGDVYLLAVSNFTGSTEGFTLLIGTNLLTGSSSASDAGVNYTSPTTVTWSGGAGNTDWTNSINWGSCAIPACGISAVVSPASTYQPTVAVNETVQNLTINPGATLTINAGVTLTVCGDFTNNGTLIASPTSTILFTNPITHNLYGSLTGTNKIGNLTITASGGTCTVKANVGVDIGGNFTTSNATSIFNTMGNYIRVAGNFNNNSASTTYTNVGTTGTLEFNGSAAQTYTPGGNLTLNNIVLNQTAASTVTLSGNNMILGTSGNLTLTQGVVVTNALEVTQNNKTVTSVTTGNTTSYVNGNLRRYLNSTGSYDFPVGNSSSYQRANINFTAATSIGNLLARFDTPAPAGPQGSTECATTYNLADLNNGYWTITASSNPTTGTYTTTLYPTAYTNSAGASAWTVIKNDGGPWYLSGTCVTSTVTKVIRNSMNGFSKFAVAQATNPLPIELLSFTGENQGSSNLISWATASETNNAYFTVEHSEEGQSYSTVAQISGAGNSTQERDYSTIDYNPFNPVTYYRLKQTDFDGNYTYSDVIAVQGNPTKVNISNLNPNPTNNNIAFDISTPVNGQVHIQIIDMYGKIIVDKMQPVGEGKTTLITDLNKVESGIYVMKIIFSQNGLSSAQPITTSINKIVKY